MSDARAPVVKPASQIKQHGAVVYLLAGAVVIGTALRIYSITDQLIISDEWHGLHAAALSSYRTLWSLLTIGATSIPMNLYYKALLDTVGWSELTVRLPSLVAGIAAVGALPLVARELLKPRATVLFAYLIAICPFLIFYSRYSRPYAIVVVLGFLSILASYQWAVRGQIRYALLFFAASVCAAFFHVLEVRTLVIPLFFFLAVKASDRFRQQGPAPPRVVPGFGALLVAGAIGMALIAALLLPAAIQTGERFSPILNKDQPTMGTFAGVLELVSGTANPIVIAAFCIFAVWGFGALFRQHRLFAGLLLIVIVGNVATVWIARPLDCYIPIVFARYLIPIFPPVLLAVAVGLDALLIQLTKLSPLGRRATAASAAALAAILLTGLFVLGPLPRLYARPNSFTNHKCFQTTYRPAKTAAEIFTRYRRQVIGPEDTVHIVVSEFYNRLREEPAHHAVIEYPLPVGDRHLVHCVYQQIHGKRVMGGYVLTEPADRQSIVAGQVQAPWPSGLALGVVNTPSRLKFHSLVDISNADAVHDSGAAYLVLHRHLPSELQAPAAYYPYPAPALIDFCKQTYGRPVFTDQWLFVFDLRHNSDSG